MCLIHYRCWEEILVSKLLPLLNILSLTMISHKSYLRLNPQQYLFHLFHILIATCKNFKDWKYQEIVKISLVIFFSIYWYIGHFLSENEYSNFQVSLKKKILKVTIFELFEILIFCQFCHIFEITIKNKSKLYLSNQFYWFSWLKYYLVLLWPICSLINDKIGYFFVPNFFRLLEADWVKVTLNTI